MTDVEPIASDELNMLISDLEYFRQEGIDDQSMLEWIGDHYPELVEALINLRTLRAENADLRQQIAYYAGGDGKGLER